MKLFTIFIAALSCTLLSPALSQSSVDAATGSTSDKKRKQVQVF